jgi:hypothetical protein
MVHIGSMEIVTMERRNLGGVTSSMRVAWDQESSIVERTRTRRATGTTRRRWGPVGRTSGSRSSSARVGYVRATSLVQTWLK